MHLISPFRTLLNYMIAEAGTGPKALILDQDTIAKISTVFSKSELRRFDNGIFLFEQLSDLILLDIDQRLPVNCIVFIRPTEQNIEQLCKELTNPKYKSYHLYFTFRISLEYVKKLARSDESEVVQNIKDFPCEFQAVSPFLFSIGLGSCTYDLRFNGWIHDSLTRTSHGLSSILFTLLSNPVIRYQTQSRLCESLAERLALLIRQESLINDTWRKKYRLDVSSLLIIFDRRSDVVTPIMNSWLYESMIHEHFTIHNNRVDLQDIKTTNPKDPKEMFLSPNSDKFFSQSYYKNYGDVGLLLKELADSIRHRKATQKRVQSIRDIKKFLKEYPELKKYEENVYNHIFLMGELTRLISDNNLMKVSECEQEISNGADMQKHIKILIQDPSVKKCDAIRLVGLHSLCKPGSSSTSSLINTLKTRKDIDKQDIELVRQLNFFKMSKTSIEETVQNVTKRIVQNVKGVDNVFTQYQPALAKIIDDIMKGKLKESDFKFQEERCLSSHCPKRLIIFFVGGVTYDEALYVDKLNRELNSKMKIIIGGTSIHNSESFIDEIRAAYSQN